MTRVLREQRSQTQGHLCHRRESGPHKWERFLKWRKRKISIYSKITLPFRYVTSAFTLSEGQTGNSWWRRLRWDPCVLRGPTVAHGQGGWEGADQGNGMCGFIWLSLPGVRTSNPQNSRQEEHCARSAEACRARKVTGNLFDLFLVYHNFPS